MKSPPPWKISETHIRLNTRPLQSRQLPPLLGERIFPTLSKTQMTDQVNIYQHGLKPYDSHFGGSNSWGGNPSVIFVDLTNPNSSPLRHSTPDPSRLNRENLEGKMKSFLQTHQLRPMRKSKSTAESKKIKTTRRALPTNLRLPIILIGWTRLQLSKLCTLWNNQGLWKSSDGGQNLD